MPSSPPKVANGGALPTWIHGTSSSPVTSFTAHMRMPCTDMLLDIKHAGEATMLGWARQHECESDGAIEMAA